MREVCDFKIERELCGVRERERDVRIGEDGRDRNGLFMSRNKERDVVSGFSFRQLGRGKSGRKSSKLSLISLSSKGYGREETPAASLRKNLGESVFFLPYHSEEIETGESFGNYLANWRKQGNQREREREVASWKSSFSISFSLLREIASSGL